MKTIASYIIAAAIAATTAAHGITTSLGHSSDLILAEVAGTYGQVEVAKSRILSDFELDYIQALAQHPKNPRKEMYLSALGSILAQAEADTSATTTQYLQPLYVLEDGIVHYSSVFVSFGIRSRRDGIMYQGTVEEMLDRALEVDAGRMDIFGHGAYISLGRSTPSTINPVAMLRIGAASASQNPDHPAYSLYLPDGKTPFPTNWNLITAEINGIQRVRLNRDGTYTTGFGVIRNLGGGFSNHATAGLIYTQSAPDGRLMIFQPQTGWKTIEQRTATTLATQAGPAIEADKRQLFHGESVVIAWTDAARVDIIDPTGNTVEYYLAPLGAIAFAPTGTGMYHIVLTDAAGTTQTREVNVLPNPAPDAWVGIEASTATAKVGEAYSVGWNSTGGTVAIVRTTPGRDTNCPDGVFHNATSGHAVFVSNAPGRYAYSIQMGSAYHQVVVEITD